MSFEPLLPPHPRPYALRPGRRPDFAGPAIHLAESRHLGTGRPAPGSALREGEIYEGNFSLSGNDGPRQRWMVVAPWGKRHIHAMDPARFRCWPLNALVQALAGGRARLAGFEPDHPMVRLQRAKERIGLRDTHLQLDSAGVEAMLSLMEEAQATAADYAPYAVAEFRNQLTFSLLDDPARATIAQRLEGIAARLAR